MNFAKWSVKIMPWNVTSQAQAAIVLGRKSHLTFLPGAKFTDVAETTEEQAYNTNVTIRNVPHGTSASLVGQSDAAIQISRSDVDVGHWWCNQSIAERRNLGAWLAYQLVGIYIELYHLYIYIRVILSLFLGGQDQLFLNSTYYGRWSKMILL